MLSSRALLIEICNFDVRRCLAKLRFIRNGDFIEHKVEMIPKVR